MNKFLSFTSLFLISCVTSVEAKPNLKSPQHFLEVVPIHIADGDTFKAQDKYGNLYTVRLLGVDCPESKKNIKCEKEGKKDSSQSCEMQIPKGLKAKEFTIKTIYKQSIVLEGELKVDVYHRTLAYVKLEDGRDFGLELIKHNLCKDWSDKYPHPRSKEYKKYSK